ncbi:MAG: hypothetical protein AAF772_10845 [Acidobacteriota bacterium]
MKKHLLLLAALTALLIGSMSSPANAQTIAGCMNCHLFIMIPLPDGSYLEVEACMIANEGGFKECFESVTAPPRCFARFACSLFGGPPVYSRTDDPTALAQRDRHPDRCAALRAEEQPARAAPTVDVVYAR